MSLILFYDTETTGIPSWKDQSEHPRQPRIWELAATLVDENTRSIVAQVDTLIRPDGWVIPPDIEQQFSITTGECLAGGIAIAKPLFLFLDMWRASDMRVGFSETFDRKMLSIEISRAINRVAVDEWKEGPSYCAMQKSRPHVDARDVNGKKKAPTLAEAFRHFTGREHVDAHRAMPDVQATMAVYWGIMDAGGEYQPAQAKPKTAPPASQTAAEPESIGDVPDFMNGV